MNILSLLLIYILVWWIVFFTLLSQGHQLEEKPQLGNDIGAPANPRMGRKIAITSGVSFGITLIFVLLAKFMGIAL